MRVRIGVLGTAEIARRRMLPAFAADPDTDVFAIASRDPAKAAALAAEYDARAMTYDGLLASAVDAVYVPLPAALHADWIEAALRAGKHVLAEKPLTTSVSRTAELVALAGDRGLALMENVMFVHHAQHAAVRVLVAEGAIGEPRAFSAAFAVPRRPPGDIRHRADLGGGALWDTGVYPVRAALHLLGSDLRVVAATLTGEPVDTAGSVLLVTAEGVSAQLTFGLDHAYRSEYEMWGSEGRVRVPNAFTPAAAHAPVLRLERGNVVEEIHLPAADQVANTVTAVVTAVRACAAPDEAILRQARLLDDIRTRSAGFPDSRTPMRRAA